MTTYTPTPEAVEAALRTREFVAGAAFGIPADAMGQAVTAALTAAGPLIERAAAERIEAEADRIDPDPEGWPADPSDAAVAGGLRRAARIARGEGS